MNVLANLLFGFRRIRTPLVTGSCWIILLWLVMRDRLPHPRDATGIVEAAYEFVGAVGKPGVLLIASLAAYLLGALTVQLLMQVLALSSVPADARTLFLRRQESTALGQLYASARSERVVGYVLRGLLPPELHGSKFQNTFSRLCAEAEFRWVTPVPVVVISIYLASVGFGWWLLLTPVTVLMVDGQRRFVTACRLLSRAGTDEASRAYAELTRSGDRSSRLAAEKDQRPGP